MANHRKQLTVVLVAVIAVGIAAIVGSTYVTHASGTDVPATDNVRIIDDRKLPEQWAINAAYGRGALSNLQAAFTEIANDNAEKARNGVAVAQSLLAKIKPESAHSTIKSLGASVTAGTDRTFDSESDFVLVHSEVQVLDDVDQTNSVRAKIESIRRELAMTDHAAIIVALDSLNVPLAYTRVDLPLRETITLVDEVLQALDAHDVDRARAKLAEIGNGLHIETLHLGIERSPAESSNEQKPS